MDIGLRGNFYGNIILCGGATMAEGFEDRLDKEIVKLAPKAAKIKIVSPPERKYSTWIGGSIVASLSNFKYLAITRDQYEENGPNIFHKKDK